MSRDYKKDMEICSAATPGPWEWSPEETGCDSETGYWGEPPSISHPKADGDKYNKAFNVYTNEDAEFIAISREALPHYINRCMTLEQQVAQMSDDLEIIIECLEDTKSENMDIAALYIARQALQSTSPARWEAVKKDNLILESDINSLKTALNEIDDECVRYHECGPFEDKEALKRVMRIRDIAVTALADLEGGGE